MHEDGQSDTNMHHVLNGLIKFVVIDGKHLSIFKLN
jgi:D-aminopeptidase